MPNPFIGGKTFAGLYGDAMVFKLEGPAVPLRHAIKWPTLAREALRNLSDK